MTITLLCQADEAGLRGLAQEAGPGGTVLCGPQPTAVATAQRAYPDRRIEVKALYREPATAPRRGPLGALATLAWMLKPGAGEEDPAEARRRVVDTSIRLIEVAKKEQHAVLVGGPLLLRLLAFKLCSIGYQGPFLRGFKPGERRHYSFRT